MVFNNEANAKFASENFVCVSASDVTYNHLPDAMKQKNEFKLLRKALADAPNGIHQGIYVVTPRGKYLGKVDQGWPTYDTAAALRNMQTMVASYKEMVKGERLAPRQLNEKDRSFHRKGYGKAPEGTVKLMSLSRGYAFGDMQLFDLRHPRYFKIDRLWYTENEMASFVPTDPRVGVVTKPDAAVMQRILRYAHFHVGGLPWNDESVTSMSLESKVVAVKKGNIYLTLEGGMELKSTTKWNNTAFTGKWLGRMIVDGKSRGVKKFELVCLGKHNLRKLASNVHRGNTTETAVATVIKLNEQGPHEVEIIPAGIQNYPRGLKPEKFQDVKW